MSDHSVQADENQSVNQLEFYTFNAGEGAFHAVRIPQKGEKKPFDIVFDCGTNKGADKLEKSISIAKDKGIKPDVIMISHYHRDHYSGIGKLIKALYKDKDNENTKPIVLTPKIDQKSMNRFLRMLIFGSLFKYSGRTLVRKDVQILFTKKKLIQDKFRDGFQKAGIDKVIFKDVVAGEKIPPCDDGNYGLESLVTIYSPSDTNDGVFIADALDYYMEEIRHTYSIEKVGREIENVFRILLGIFKRKRKYRSKFLNYLKQEEDDYTEIQMDKALVNIEKKWKEYDLPPKEWTLNSWVS